LQAAVSQHRLGFRSPPLDCSRTLTRLGIAANEEICDLPVKGTFMSPLHDWMDIDRDAVEGHATRTAPRRGTGRQKYLTRCRHTRRKSRGASANGTHRRRQHRNYL